MLEVIAFYIGLFIGLTTLMLIIIAIGCAISPSFRREFIDDWNR